MCVCFCHVLYCNMTQHVNSPTQLWYQLQQQNYWQIIYCIRKDTFMLIKATSQRSSNTRIYHEYFKIYEEGKVGVLVFCDNPKSNFAQPANLQKIVKILHSSLITSLHSSKKFGQHFSQSLCIKMHAPLYGITQNFPSFSST